MSAQHNYKFDIKMNCGGCSGAVTRALKDVEGISSYEVSLEKQEVLVTGSITYDALLAKLTKTGKEVRSGETLLNEEASAASEKETVTTQSNIPAQVMVQ